jgi:hypothetical protein
VELKLSYSLRPAKVQERQGKINSGLTLEEAIAIVGITAVLVNKNC